LLEELASAFQVDGLDLRGHGLSGRVPGAYRLQDYVPGKQNNSSPLVW
jgi:alpha-beta hydrolase superfamily lysophospholipase